MARLLAPFLWVPSYFHSLRLCLLKSILRLQVIIASLSVFFAICSLSLFLGSLCLSSLVSPYRNSIQGDVSLGLIPGITGCLKETPFILIQQNYHIFNMWSGTVQHAENTEVNNQMWSLIYNLVRESSIRLPNSHTSKWTISSYGNCSKENYKVLKDSVSGNLVKVGRSGKAPWRCWY